MVLKSGKLTSWGCFFWNLPFSYKVFFVLAPSKRWQGGWLALGFLVAINNSSWHETSQHFPFRTVVIFNVDLVDFWDFWMAPRADWDGIFPIYCESFLPEKGSFKEWRISWNPRCFFVIFLCDTKIVTVKGNGLVWVFVLFIWEVHRIETWILRWGNGVIVSKKTTQQVWPSSPTLWQRPWRWTLRRASLLFREELDVPLPTYPYGKSLYV